MKNKIKIYRAFWLRFWHCLYYGYKTFLDPHEFHYQHTAKNEDGSIKYIGCKCGECFYKNFKPVKK